MYGAPDSESDEDTEEMPTLIGRFAALWDECDREQN